MFGACLVFGNSDRFLSGVFLNVVFRWRKKILLAKKKGRDLEPKSLTILSIFSKITTLEIHFALL